MIRKIKIIFCIIYLFKISELNAQDSKLSLTMRGGMNISNVTSDVSQDPFFERAGKHGFSAGFSFGYRFNPHFLLLAECVYDQKGYSQNFFLTDNVGNTIGDANSFVNLNYISVPVIANLVFGSVHSIEMGFGVCNNVLIDANVTNPISYFGISTGSIDVKGNYKTYELSAVARLGGSIQLASPISLIFEARYQAGFINIVDDYFGNTSEKNNVAYFGTGIRINFSKKSN